jgi:hypothetical protein
MLLLTVPLLHNKISHFCSSPHTVV